MGREAARGITGHELDRAGQGGGNRAAQFDELFESDRAAVVMHLHAKGAVVFLLALAFLPDAALRQNHGVWVEGDGGRQGASLRGMRRIDGPGAVHGRGKQHLISLRRHALGLESPLHGLEVLRLAAPRKEQPAQQG
nr:hypothetical protein [Pontibacter virosus]